MFGKWGQVKENAHMVTMFTVHASLLPESRNNVIPTVSEQRGPLGWDGITIIYV